MTKPPSYTFFSILSLIRSRSKQVYCYNKEESNVPNQQNWLIRTHPLVCPNMVEFQLLQLRFNYCSITQNTHMHTQVCLGYRFIPGLRLKCQQRLEHYVAAAAAAGGLCQSNFTQPTTNILCQVHFSFLMLLPGPL